MMRSWEKMKRSGTYRRAVQKQHDTMLKRSREITVELRKIRERPAMFINKSHHQLFINDSQSMVAQEVSTPASIDHIAITSSSIDSDNIGGNSNADGDLNASDDNGLWNGDETDMERNEKFRTHLRKWAIEHQINHLALKHLTKLINTDIGVMLPEDPRTLLQTPQAVNITKIDNDGQYWHHGLERSLQCVLRNISELQTISVNVNIDGLPIFDSSKTEFWPILFNITEMPQLPAMVIGIYCAKSKCYDLQAFLTPFVNEMKEVVTNGILINSHKVTVKLRSIICDSPARAYVKGVANFNGHHGCQKCTTIGEYSDVSNTNIFPRTECEKRTDAGFRQKLYAKHYKHDSPLLNLDIDMVEQFPVGDSLHLLHLGAMKRLLFGWRDGTLRLSDTKWPARTTNEVSAYLLQCKMPAEFHRAVRGLDCLSHWKGTEYRTFLHYVGIVALKDHLPHQAYVHFLLLFCAVTICTSKKYFEMLPIARAMLLQFIEMYAELYGEHHLTSNVHNLSHVVDEVELFGELDTFSAYPFENALGKIKRLLRNGSRPLAQVAKRIIEDFSCTMTSGIITNSNTLTPVKRKPILSKRNDGENVPDFFTSSSEEGYNFFSKVQLKEFCLSTDPGNCWFLTKENEIACVSNIIQRHKQPEDVQLYCIEIDEKENFFTVPLESSHFNIYSSHSHAHLGKKEKILYMLSDVKCKLVSLPYGDMQVFIPLLHTA